MQEFQEGLSSYTLQQVCAECEVPSHVLIYWSDFFEVLKDEDGHLKSTFTPEELTLIRKVKKCLYSQCMTVVEAKKALAEDVKAIVQAKEASVATSPESEVTQVKEEEPAQSEPEFESAPTMSSEAESSAEVPITTLEPREAGLETPNATAPLATKSLTDLLEGNLSQLEAVVATQKNRFEERLSEQRNEFSAVESECAARVSDLSSDLTEALEKTRRLEELLTRTLKDLEAFREAAFGDK